MQAEILSTFNVGTRIMRMSKTLVIINTLFLCGLTSNVQAVDDYTVELYELYCKACHTVEGAATPIAFSPNDWSKRLKQGLDGLVDSAINGVGNMPAQGLCQECTYEDFEDLINYMVSPKPVSSLQK
jgi:cytochrome c5